MTLGFGIGLTKYIPFVIYFAGIIPVFLALFLKVELAFGYLVGILPLTNVLNKLHQFPLGKDYVDILLAAVLFGWFIRANIRREKFIVSTPFNLLLVVFILYTYVGLWQGSSFLGLPSPLSFSDVRVQTWKNYVILPLLFFITVNNIKDKKRMQWLVFIMVLVILVSGLYFFQNYRYIGKTVFREAKRMSGTFSYLGPNEWGAFHAHYLFVILGMLLVDKQKLIKRLLFILAVLFSTYSILFSYSRGAYIALLLGLIFISLVKKRAFVIPLIIFMIFWQSLLPPAVVQRVNETQNEEGELESSAQKRLILWDTGIAIFQRSPLFGAGFNTLPYVGLGGGFADTHNIYVKFLAEEGVIGLLIFLSILFLALMQGWKLYTRAKDTFFKGLGLGFVTCVIAMAVTNFFGDRWTYLPIGAYFWVFLGLVTRGNMIVREEVSKK